MAKAILGFLISLALLIPVPSNAMILSGVFSGQASSTISYNSWTYHKAISLDTRGTASGCNTHTCPSIATSLTNFPILVQINSSSWGTAGDRTHFFSDTYNPLGKRVRFYASDQTTVLPYEVESYSTGGQAANYWVNVGTITGNNANSNVIYLAYGNDPTGGVDQDSATSTWNSNYKMVAHMTDYTTSQVNDSTTNGKNFTKTSAGHPASATGYVGNGQSYGGTAGVDNLISGLVTTAVDNIMASCWVNFAGTYDASLDMALIQNGAAIDTNGWALGIQHGTKDWMIMMGGVANSVTTTAVSNSTNYYAVAVRDSGTWKIYVNNSALTLDASKTSTPGTPTLRTAITTYDSYGSFSGVVDECRIETKPASNFTDWIAGEYYSMLKTTWNGDNWVVWGSEL